MHEHLHTNISRDTDQNGISQIFDNFTFLHENVQQYVHFDVMTLILLSDHYLVNCLNQNGDIPHWWKWAGPEWCIACYHQSDFHDCCLQSQTCPARMVHLVDKTDQRLCTVCPFWCITSAKCHIGPTRMVHLADTPDQQVTVESSLLWKSCLCSMFTSKLVAVLLQSLHTNPLGILSKQMALTVIQSLRYKTLLIV